MKKLHFKGFVCVYKNQFTKCSQVDQELHVKLMGMKIKNITIYINI